MQALFSEAVDAERAARDLQRVMKHRELPPRQQLFAAGDPSDEIYFITAGCAAMCRAAVHIRPFSSLQWPGDRPLQAVGHCRRFGISGSRSGYVTLSRTAVLRSGNSIKGWCQGHFSRPQVPDADAVVPLGG